ncbi:MAG: flagellar basal-body rod protein FlgG [Gammaproteobacteria bacterium CG22_combo_CG10-13_8_21_14_all_40_8]|nr:MAG: flagellar basal-body rod protein FlgG [Gammaproteobacteria bacterium CG22_combo_CG10-13_8_21_14_all_40_8]
MHPALWISKTGVDAQQTDISVISNNLANASTVGYKKGRAVFEDMLYQNVRQPGSQSSQNTELSSGLMLGTGVKVVGVSKSFTQGNMIVTDNATDVAIQGRGFFQVLLPDGTAAYSRNGEFSLDNTGQLVTGGNGYVVQPAITIPQDAQSISVGQDGTISVQLPGQTAPSSVGNLTLVDFVNPAGLQPMGENLFKETASSGAATTGTPGLAGFGSLVGGALEASNVSVVEELVGLIETQRTYEMNSKVISAVDDMMSFINQTL